MEFLVTVHDEAVLAKLKRMPAAMRQGLERVVNRLATDIQASVMRDKLTGQALHVRTGTLRRSITKTPAEWSADRVSAHVFTTLNYGIGWEEGFDRQVGAGARGGPRTLRGRALQRYFERHPPAIKSYAARPFLRPTLEEFKPKIQTDLRKAVMEALHGA